MPSLDWCIECDKPFDVLDWRGLCEKCSEKENNDEQKNLG